MSFILASVGSGALVAQNSAGNSPGGPADNQILLLVLAASAVLVLACIGIPPAIRRPESAARVGRRWVSGRRPPVLALCNGPPRRCNRAISSITASGRSIGASSGSDTVIGALWAEGVVAEILFVLVQRAAVGPLRAARADGRWEVAPASCAGA